MSAVYNFDSVLEGASLAPRVFAIKRKNGENLINLTGCKVEFEVFRSSTSKIYLKKDNDEIGGIEINDPVACLLTINQISDPELTPALYYWHLKITYTDGIVIIPLGGKFRVLTIKDFADV